MRRILDFNQGWSFLKEVSDPMQTSSENGEPVNLPHTWNALDGQDGGDDYYRGCCCYVKQFERPELKEREQVYLEFQGASASASVTVNGRPQGSHDGGYSAFRVNITGALQAFNTVAVAVDNSVNGRVYPQTADFTFYGGIYRDVTMVIVSSGHFDLDYFGSSGIKLTPILVDMAEQDPAGTRQNIAVPTQNSCGIKQGTASDRKAVVMVEAWIKGVTEGEIRVMIEGEGEPETAEIKFDFDAEPGGFRSAAAHRVTAELIIAHPHLWNGRKDPFLYRAAVQLIADGALQDEVTQKFGCRTFYTDPQNGFFLNGEPCPLRGVSRHQDREGVGNALTREMHREDMELIAELGANSIRLAHYQHDRYFYDLCDEYGMVVWAEIPYITRHMPEGRENTLGQLRELIVQNYHHPAICFWGISNEISAGGLNGGVIENNRALHELARELDPTRPTAMACAFMLDDQNEMLQITDLTAYNHYFGWYVGEVEDNGIWFDRFHEAHPELAAGLSEYGAEAVLKWQSAAPEKEIIPSSIRRFIMKRC